MENWNHLKNLIFIIFHIVFYLIIALRPICKRSSNPLYVKLGVIIVNKDLGPVYVQFVVQAYPPKYDLMFMSDNGNLGRT